MNWIKENWFKLAIILLAIWFLSILSFGVVQVCDVVYANSQLIGCNRAQ